MASWRPKFTHPGFQALAALAQKHRQRLAAGLLILGVVLYWAGAFSTPPPPPEPPPKVPVMKRISLGGEKAQEDQLTLTQQARTAEMLQQIPTLEKEVRALTQAVKQSVQAKQDSAETMERQFAALQKDTKERVDAALAKIPTKQPAAKTTPPPQTKAKATTVPGATGTPSGTSGHKLVILKSDGKDSWTGSPTRADHADVPYLQYGSLARGRVITGAMASSQAYGGRASSGSAARSGLPILFEVLTPFMPPHQLQGSGQNPTGTEVPLQGCRWGGRVVADLSSSRAWVELEMLSCVMPSGEAYVQPLKGYVTDGDGTYGMVGKVTHHESQAEAKLFFTSLLQEAAAAFGYARAKVLVTGTGYGGYGGIQPGQGFQTGLQKMADYYLQQMALLTPTLWVQSGAEGWLIVEDNVHLDGLPTEIVLRQQQFTPQRVAWR